MNIKKLLLRATFLRILRLISFIIPISIKSNLSWLIAYRDNFDKSGELVPYDRWRYEILSITTIQEIFVHCCKLANYS